MNTPTVEQPSQHIDVPASRSRRRHRTAIVVGGLALAGSVLGACSSSSPNRGSQSAPVTVNSTAAATDTTSRAADNVVLPVPNNPIVNTATAQTLKIDSVLVENNVDANGKTASDHLEIALSNSGTTDAAEIEVFYTFADQTAGVIENYYTKLPADFTIPAGGTRIVHFDDTGAPDHFPVNKFSLYYTSKNAMDVSVIVSAKDAAIRKFDLKKDAGGAEAAD